MKANYSMIAAAALAFVQWTPADAATTDPEVIIYRVPGVLDNGGGGGAGTATVFHCTNFSGVSETLRFVTRNFDGALKTNVSVAISHLATVTAQTKPTIAYFVVTNLATGPVTQGTTAIAATSINIICTAMIVDAANAKPVGVALRGIRFNPIPGTQE